MQRVKAALGGVLAIAILFGGLVVIRLVTRLIAVTVWFAETVAVFLFACAVGYVIYRVLLGDSDNPRYS